MKEMIMVLINTVVWGGLLFLFRMDIAATIKEGVMIIAKCVTYPFVAVYEVVIGSIEAIKRIGAEIIAETKEFYRLATSNILVIPACYLVLLAFAIVTSGDQNVTVQSPTQYVIVDVVDSKTAIVEEYNSKERVTVTFDSYIYSSMIGTGVQFDEIERVTPFHIQTKNAKWG